MRGTSIFILFFLICNGATCKKKCIPKSYSFSVSMTARPDSDSVNINDTIWFEMNIPSLQRDEVTGGTIDFSSAINLSTTIKAARFIGGSISNPGVVDAENNFEFKMVNGTEINNIVPGVLLSIRPLELNGRYIIKCGIVPKSIGIFTLAIGNSATVQRTNDECSEAGFSITFANTNQHLYFYEQNRPGYIPSEYERTHMYCFKVK